MTYMRPALLALAFCLAAAALFFATSARSECFDSLDKATIALDRVFGQHPRGLGIQDSDQRGESPLVLFLNPDTRHWSILQLIPGAGFCIAAVGRDWRVPPVGLPS